MRTIGEIKDRVKALAAEGRRIRREEYAPASGPEKDAAWRRKKGVGAQARGALLALAMLRGRPRTSQERAWDRNGGQEQLVAWSMADALGHGNPGGRVASGLEAEAWAARRDEFKRVADACAAWLGVAPGIMQPRKEAACTSSSEQTCVPA